MATPVQTRVQSVTSIPVSVYHAGTAGSALTASSNAFSVFLAISSPVNALPVNRKNGERFANRTVIGTATYVRQQMENAFSVRRDITGEAVKSDV